LDTPTKNSSNHRLDEPIPLLSHLDELKKRLIYSLIAIVICSFAVYPFVDIVIRDLAKPVGKFIFTGPVEAFWTRIKLTFFMGLFASMPVVLFQIWSFIQRGLMPKEKHMVGLITVISFVLFAGGASFCYFLIIPVGVGFLLAYGSDVMVPMISISRYLSFVFGMVFSFGIVFELPLVIGFLAKIGILQSITLRKQRRFAIVIIFIAAAALTPGPDVFSQVLMALPLLVLYEAGIIVARIIEKRRKQNG
jgi:sec-independent protein translocase protein TatC